MYSWKKRTAHKGAKKNVTLYEERKHNWTKNPCNSGNSFREYFHEDRKMGNILQPNLATAI